MTRISAAAARAIAHFEALSSGGPLDRSLRVTINFHPDWPEGEKSTLEMLSQNAAFVPPQRCVSATVGSEMIDPQRRAEWENRVFGGAYDGSSAQECPLYGALNYTQNDAGANLRAGSAHLRLAEHVLQRCTFALDARQGAHAPLAVGTATRFNLLPTQRDGDSPRSDDAQIIAHIHGPIVFARDVEAVVLDPAHRGTDTDYEAHQLGVGVEWHHGRKLLGAQLTHLSHEYGSGPVRVGKEIAADSEVNARIIGYALANGRYNTEHLEQLWQLVARYGTE